MIKFRHILFIFAFPVLDIALLIRVQKTFWSRYMSSGEAFLLTLGLCIGTALVGIKIAKREGIGLLARLQQSALNPTGLGRELFEALCISIGGLALVMPGYISDTIGVMLLLPWFRSLAVKFLEKKFAHAAGSIHFSNQTLWHAEKNSSPAGRAEHERDPTIIDVEPID